MTSTLESTVTNWREVLSVVKPFYERFFGEEMPELEGMVFTPKDLTKQNNLSKGARAELAESFVRCCCVYSPKYDLLGMPDHPMDKLHIASLLFHELTHRNRFKEATKLKKISDVFLNTLSHKRADFNLFLEECISSISENCFYLSQGFYPSEEQKKAINKSCALETIEKLEYKINNYKICDAMDRTINSAINSSALPVAGYVALQYYSDPNLWSKLKSLRTLDDLKKLVREE